ncbi:Hypothetical predicted protein [Olea europaea subsp. europaea]|uniref:Uncharacterized protein n=1 Tax=Olea europaea subsp. europaea TaxID=158383 RepID=A0A8S0SP72_OLEEU|nr:Hypothetical predicted protein [Olea europaea subsp. europaea]
MQVWAYEALLEIGLYVYVTFRPTNAEAEQPYFSTLVPYDDPPVPVLDDITRTLLRRSSMHHTLTVEMVDNWQGRVPTTELPMEDMGANDRSSDGEDTCRGQTSTYSTPRAPQVTSLVRGSTMETRTIGTSGSSLTRREVEELLLDQRILLEMQLRIMKLEIEQHVTLECKKLQEFLATLMAPVGWTTATAATPADTEVELSCRLPQGRGLIEQQLDVPDLNDRGTIEPSHAAPINDAKFEGCAVMDGDGVVTEAPLPATVPEVGCVLPTRRRSARLRRPAPSTRTPYTRGRSEHRSKCE